MERPSFDLDPAIFDRPEMSPLRKPGPRHLRAELRRSFAGARLALRDTDRHQEIFQLLLDFPLFDLTRGINSMLPIMRNPTFLDMARRRVLPELSTAGTRQLLTLPEDTLGFQYATFVHERGLTDAYLNFLEFPDTPLKYLAWRTALLHDLLHFLLGYEPMFPVSEMQVESFLLFQTGALNHFILLSGWLIHFKTHRPDYLPVCLEGIRASVARAHKIPCLITVDWQAWLSRPMGEVVEFLGLVGPGPCPPHRTDHTPTLTPLP